MATLRMKHFKLVKTSLKNNKLKIRYTIVWLVYIALLKTAKGAMQTKPLWKTHVPRTMGYKVLTISIKCCNKNGTSFYSSFQKMKTK